MIFTVLLRDDIDQDLAKTVSRWLWRLGMTDAEFYVWGDHRETDA